MQCRQTNFSRKVMFCSCWEWGWTCLFSVLWTDCACQQRQRLR